MEFLVQNRLLQKIFAVAGLTMALLAPMPVMADYDYAPREMALLPPYCKYTQLYRSSVPGGDDPAQAERWKSNLGYMYDHMHHYCRGLQQTNYAKIFAHTSGERMERWKQSIGEFDYVLKYMKPDYALLPEVLTKKGENLIRMGRAAEAMEPLQLAIKLKPDYWPPYAALSDYYKEAGDLKNARGWLELALAISPDAKGLKLRLAELDAGKGKRKTAPEVPVKPATQ